MKSRPRTILSLFLSATLAFGTIPAPALAEMTDEAMGEETTAGPAAAGSAATEPVLALQATEGEMGTESTEGLVSQEAAPSEAPAEGGEIIVNVEPTVQTLPPMDGSDNKELLDAYAQRKIDEPLRGNVLQVQSAADGLTGKDLVAYTKIKEKVSLVASGTLASSKFSIPLEDIAGNGCTGPWTAAELGVTAVVENNAITQEAKDALSEKVSFDYSKVVQALLADCPYDLYWFDKASGGGYRYQALSSFSGGYDQGKHEYTISCEGPAVLEMRVSANYSLTGEQGTTDVNTTFGTTITTAVNKAQQIVTDNAGKSVLERMAAYKDAICNEVAYNSAAAGENPPPYGNPWQLIWVFDGNENTNVVCEGYSKAFKYLCDLTWPKRESGVECLLVSGTMIGGTGAGNHMWNVVHMDDGGNYLVDVTNCDEGTIGATDKLFMAYGPSGSYASGYTFSLGDRGNIKYVYRDSTKATFSEDALTISSQAYTAPTTLTSVEVPTAATGLEYNAQQQTGVAEGTGYTLSGTVAATAAGNYSVTATLKAGYKWNDGTTTSKTINWSIARKPVTVTADDKTKTYGAADPVLTATVEGVLGTDTVAYSLSRAAGNDVGSYAITSTGAAEQGNYAVSFEPGTLTIGPKTLGLSWSNTSFTYDGNPHVPTVTPSGLVSNDTVSLGVDGSQANAGTYTATATLADGSNYCLPENATCEFTIAQAASSVTTAPAANTLTYGGEPQALVSAGVASGGSMSYSTDNVTWSEDVPQATNAGTYDVWYKVVGDPNHTDTAAAGPVEATIARKPVTVTADDKTKAQGEADPELTATVAGTLGTDTVEYSLSRAAGNDVGTYAITPTGATEQGNYAVTFVQGTLTIVDTSSLVSIAEATVAFDPASYTYTGSAQKPSATVTLDDVPLIAGTDYDLSYTDNVNVGTATVTVTGKGNYTGFATGTFQITKAPLTVRAKNHAVTYGDSPANDGVVYEGLLGNDTASALGGELQYSYGYSQYGNVGTYEITPSGLTADNYDITFVPGTLTVGPKTLGLSWSNTSFTYDAQSHAPTVTPSGLVNNDTVSLGVDGSQTNAGTYTATATLADGSNYCLPQSKTCSFTIAKATRTVSVSMGSWTYGEAAKTPVVTGDLGDSAVTYRYGELDASIDEFTDQVPTNAGSYLLEVVVAESENYLQSNVFANFAIAQAASSVTTAPAANTLTYGGEPQALVSAGVASGGSMSYSTDNVTWSEDVPQATDAGTYDVWYKVVGDPNHTDTASAGPVEATIARKSVTVTADDKTKAQGEADPELTATVVGTLGTDTVEYSLSRAAGNDVGTYAITPTGAIEQGNYSVTFLPGTLTIQEPAPVVLPSGTWGTCPWEISESGVLTIYPGEGRSQGEGLSGTSLPTSPWYAYSDSVTSVVFAEQNGNKVKLPADCRCLFLSMGKVVTVDATGVDTSQVTDLSYMFHYCYALTSIQGISNWDTSHVTKTCGMFVDCQNLASLDLSAWDVSHVTDMSGMFWMCWSLSSLNVEGWNTSQVTDAYSMFAQCSSIASLDLSGWNTSKMAKMQNMFDGCSRLASLDISGWDTSSLTSAYRIFAGCAKLESLDLSSWDTSQLTNMNLMFENCSQLSSLKVGSGYAIKAAGMFPDATAANGKWWSTRDQAWYTKDQIASSRSGVADTYANQELPVTGPTSQDGVDWSPVYDPAYYAEQNPDVADWARRAGGSYGDNLLRHFVNNGAKEGRRSREDFSLASYYNANADLRRAFGTDWSRYYRHYCTNGARENRAHAGVLQLVAPLASRDGVDWSPVYDGNHYAQQNRDVASWASRKCGAVTVLDDAALLQHFVGNGAKEGRKSKDSFELASYYNANADLRRAFGTSDWSKYYRHYATNGAREGRLCRGVGTLRGALASRDGVDWSPVYDGAYYAQQNADVARWATRSFNSGSVVDDAALLQHFVNIGAKEGRRSKDGFELASYYNAHADLRRAFGTDWARYYRHYATNGARERRTCSGVGTLRGFATSLGGVDWAPVYDANEYSTRNPDLASWARRSFSSGSVLDDAALLSHFVNNGQRERRQAKSTFNVTNYRNRYADLNRAFGDNWPSYYRHFATNGYKENRNGA